MSSITPKIAFDRNALSSIPPWSVNWTFYIARCSGLKRIADDDHRLATPKLWPLDNGLVAYFISPQMFPKKNPPVETEVRVSLKRTAYSRANRCSSSFCKSTWTFPCHSCCGLIVSPTLSQPYRLPIVQVSMFCVGSWPFTPQLLAALLNIFWMWQWHSSTGYTYLIFLHKTLRFLARCQRGTLAQRRFKRASMSSRSLTNCDTR